MAYPFNAERYARIVAMLKEGKRQADVARELGLPRYTIYNTVERARRVGDLNARSPKVDYHFNKARTLHGATGSLKGLMRDLSAEASEWLIDETPEGATIADTIRAIVQDAYEGENG